MAGALVDRPCAEFVRAVAARTPTPGGGGVAALAGALGVALGAMAGEYTLGKPRYAAVEQDVRAAVARAGELAEALLGLVDADAEAFGPLSRAYAIPRDDPSRAEAVERATVEAMAVPRRVLGLACEAVPVLEELAEKGTRMLRSDVGCAAALVRAALECAALNVYANTSGLSDRELAARVEAETADAAAAFSARAQAVADDVAHGLRGGC